MDYKAKIMSSEDMNRTLKRLAHQIIEKNGGVDNLCLIGIKTRGVPLAERIAQNIEKFENQKIEVGQLDITLYRDDLSKINIDPIINKTDVPFSIEDKIVVLVDDVIFTGRTARAALDALVELGRPAKIQLCELIDRGHTELPIKANFVGKNIPTSRSEIVSVKVKEIDGKDIVVIKDM
ncbi:MAG: bifunctional pyr operon transcriptional regulator/uracil phosphoribosyltransferase PyrR [Bacillota bacterium]|jgi:pyrimidine operon attenuation protein/uracil phosphoribosyltransferase|nr:bifunctional pyr operon transcriptional regulator/uracil phosphoribosyltransferase PyrR [Bacillota bacterium]NLL25929.1 bifunctional pyr operon transcriptional regulator/uracil phosphoribosyltransferase PyrR [Erysipelotrichia bacterium]